MLRLDVGVGAAVGCAAAVAVAVWMARRDRGDEAEFAFPDAWTPDGARAAREAGNRHFADGRYDAAVAAYHGALCACGQALPGAAAAAEQRVLLSNVAMALLKLERFAEAADVATAALRGDVPAGLRGRLLFRRSTALLALRRPAAAVADLEAAASLAGEPDPMLLQQLGRARAAVAM